MYSNCASKIYNAVVDIIRQLLQDIDCDSVEDLTIHQRAVFFKDLRKQLVKLEGQYQYYSIDVMSNRNLTGVTLMIRSLLGEDIPDEYTYIDLDMNMKDVFKAKQCVKLVEKRLKDKKPVSDSDNQFYSLSRIFPGMPNISAELIFKYLTILIQRSRSKDPIGYICLYKIFTKYLSGSEQAKCHSNYQEFVKHLHNFSKLYLAFPNKCYSSSSYISQLPDFKEAFSNLDINSLNIYHMELFLQKYRNLKPQQPIAMLSNNCAQNTFISRHNELYKLLIVPRHKRTDKLLLSQSGYDFIQTCVKLYEARADKFLSTI